MKKQATAKPGICFRAINEQIILRSRMETPQERICEFDVYQL